MQTKKLAEKYKDYVIKMRREFHMNPEERRAGQSWYRKQKHSWYWGYSNYQR